MPWRPGVLIRLRSLSYAAHVKTLLLLLLRYIAMSPELNRVNLSLRGARRPLLPPPDTGSLPRCRCTISQPARSCGPKDCQVSRHRLVPVHHRHHTSSPLNGQPTTPAATHTLTLASTTPTARSPLPKSPTVTSSLNIEHPHFSPLRLEKCPETRPVGPCCLKPHRCRASPSRRLPWPLAKTSAVSPQQTLPNKQTTRQELTIICRLCLRRRAQQAQAPQRCGALHLLPLPPAATAVAY